MQPELFLDGKVSLFCGDSRDVLKTLGDNSVDSVCCDPPYALVSIGKRFGKKGAAPSKIPPGGSGAYARASSGFMGKQWDTGETAFAVEFWAEVLRVLKPGGHVLAFSGTRTYHRLACAIEDAGFEIRDMCQWLYGSGFPKSHDVSKGIDKAAGVEREIVGTRQEHNIKGGNLMEASQGKAAGTTTVFITKAGSLDAKNWEGWGTALKPANEPICLGRKPLSEPTVAANVLKWGTGAINIDGSRISNNDDNDGRFPANVFHDGSSEILAEFPYTHSTKYSSATVSKGDSQIGTFNISERTGDEMPSYADEGSAARFFYTAKADARDRIGSKHPTVKPVDLMRYFAQLITPPGGTVLDPFAGTGSTGEGAWRAGLNSILIERESEYQADIRRRMALAFQGPRGRAEALAAHSQISIHSKGLRSIHRQTVR